VSRSPQNTAPALQRRFTLTQAGDATRWSADLAFTTVPAGARAAGPALGRALDPCSAAASDAAAASATVARPPAALRLPAGFGARGGICLVAARLDDARAFKTAASAASGAAGGAAVLLEGTSAPGGAEAGACGPALHPAALRVERPDAACRPGCGGRMVVVDC
jgi:hypothetical protein